MTIFGRDVHVHAACFDELDAALEALREEQGITQPVYLNAHAFGYPAFQGQTRRDAIIYNLENVGIQIQNDAFLEHEVWDFSSSNTKKLQTYRDAMITRPQKPVVFVPVGYHESMTRFTPRDMKDRDIDIVFMGSLNARRTAILDELHNRGLNVKYVEHTAYGVPRDELLARSKIALNVRYYENGLYPALRTLHCLSNNVLVVSEDAPEKPLWSRYSMPYNGVATLCLNLLRDKNMLEAITEKEHEYVKRFPMRLPVNEEK